MSTTRTVLRLAGALAFALPLVSVAGPVYRGTATATDFLHPEVTSGGTTGGPKGYMAVLSGSTATSQSGSANGGSVEASATSGAGSNAGASTGLVYTVDLVGPAETYVPIHVTGFGFVEGLQLGAVPTMSASASLVINVDDPGGNYQLFGNATLDLTGARRTFAIDEIIRVYAGRSLEVLLDVSAASYGLEGNPSYAHAFVDPTFTIDAAFASRYRLEGIPGADVVDPPPTSGVPEPGTVVLVATGLALASLRGRRTGPRLRPSAA